MSLKFRRNKAMKLFEISKQEKMTKDLALRQSNRRVGRKKKPTKTGMWDKKQENELFWKPTEESILSWRK